MKILVLDVLAFFAGEAFGHRNEQLPAEEAVRAVLDFGQLVQALDHEAVELVADWHLVLAVDLNHVVGDNSFEIGGPVLCGPGTYASIPLSNFSKDFMLEPLTRATAIIVDENDVGTSSLWMMGFNA